MESQPAPAWVVARGSPRDTGKLAAFDAFLTAMRIGTVPPAPHIETDNRLGAPDVATPVATLPDMTQPSDHEARISRLEVRIEEVAADAGAARHLAAANDRDFADISVKVDANRRAINALAEQTRGGFDRVDERFAQVDKRFARLEAKVDAGFAFMQSRFTEMDQGFAAMRHGFDQTAAGFARIAELIDRRDDDR